MKKVRALKEFPGAKVGDKYDVERCNISTSYIHVIVSEAIPPINYPVLELVEWGYLEWVKEEKSLKSVLCDKVESYVSSHGSHGEDYEIDFELVSQIVTDHFKAKFDEAWRDNFCIGDTKSLKSIRKAMFGEDA
jgi:hypothetical protein